VSTVQRREQQELKFGQYTIRESFPMISTLVAKSKWNTRAWTYQELRYSRCCLFFSHEQVYFICRGVTSSEAIPYEDEAASAALMNHS
jgi:hypothetical protein